jgi:hypothetical protein
MRGRDAFSLTIPLPKATKRQCEVWHLFFTVDPPAGQTMEQFELNVLRAFDAYIDGTERYDQFDTPGSGKNSNAFAYGLLIAAGVGKGDLPSKWDLTGWNPGWGDPVEITIDATDN